MGNILALLFLAYCSFEDIRFGKISWIAIAFFFIIALIYNPAGIIAMFCMYALAYFVADEFDRNGMEFGGGDVKVLSILAGLTTLLTAIATLGVALLAWRILKYPNTVKFLPFILGGFVVCLLIQYGLGVGTC